MAEFYFVFIKQAAEIHLTEARIVMYISKKITVLYLLNYKKCE